MSKYVLRDPLGLQINHKYPNNSLIQKSVVAPKADLSVTSNIAISVDPLYVGVTSPCVTSNIAISVDPLEVGVTSSPCVTTNIVSSVDHPSSLNAEFATDFKTITLPLHLLISNKPNNKETISVVLDRQDTINLEQVLDDETPSGDDKTPSGDSDVNVIHNTNNINVIHNTNNEDTDEDDENVACLLTQQQKKKIHELMSIVMNDQNQIEKVPSVSITTCPILVQDKYLNAQTKQETLNFPKINNTTKDNSKLLTKINNYKVEQLRELCKINNLSTIGKRNY